MKKLIKAVLVSIFAFGMMFVLLFKLLFSNEYIHPELNNTNLSNFNYYQELAHKMNYQILNTKKEISVDEEFINNMIQKKLEEENYFHYDKSFLGISYEFKIVNLWSVVNQKDMDLYGNLSLNGHYISGIKLNLKVSTDETNNYIHLNKLSMGKLPISPVVMNLIGNNIDKEIDLHNNTIIIPIQTINEKISDNLYTNAIKIDQIFIDTEYLKISYTIFNR